MALRESRKITGDLMVHYKHKLYRILPSPETLKMVRKTCEVVEWIDGSVELRCDGVTLPYALSSIRAGPSLVLRSSKTSAWAPP